MSEFISVASINKLVGTPQTVTPLWAPQGTPFAYGARLEYARLHNRSGVSAVVGIGVHLPDSIWYAGQWVNADTHVDVDTTDAQDSDANDFPLNSALANDGHIIGSAIKFNAISYNITTISTALGTWVVEYWNGSAWTTITNNFIAPDYRTSGEVVVVFGEPFDWAVGGSGTNVDAAKYNLRIRATAPPLGPQPVAQRIHIFKLYLLQESVADNGILEFNPTKTFVDLARQGSGLVALFSTADAGNLVEALVNLH